ncbi:MAG: hypothetical protein K9K64_01655 [Desulfohalobiaceae bacterium]|nr:hypothetical protein [Desulfohalobiaceae bacterium]
MPGADIDRQGLCRYCRDYQVKDNQGDEQERQKREADLEQALSRCRGRGEYDCLVPVSGGKDSLYLLYILKKHYDLNVLAFTTDVNIPDLAWKNIQRALRILDIDHLSFSASFCFYTKLFRYLLQNQEERGAVYTVSYVYAPLFEGDAIRIALEKDIPLILAGYSPGQPEPERMFYEFSRILICETDWCPPALKQSGIFSESELGRFFNPDRYPRGTEFPRYLAPFHAWTYNQEEVMQAVVEAGLVSKKKHANPVLTNYPINWLLMYSDLRHFGYNPYHPEFSALIREGKANRTYWRVVAPVVNVMIRQKILLGREVARSLKWLDLEEDDLRINQPRGAYDPPLYSKDTGNQL